MVTINRILCSVDLTSDSVAKRFTCDWARNGWRRKAIVCHGLSAPETVFRPMGTCHRGRR